MALVRVIGVLVLASFALLSTPSLAQSPPPEDLQRLFQRLLDNPSDVALNFRYAQAAFEQNRLRSALAAYERILATDPTNEEAKAGIRRIERLLQPEFTSATLGVGGQYETNPRRAGFGRSGGDDFSGIAQAELVDERRVGDVHLRSEGQLFGNFYKRFSDINFGRIAANTGPVLDVGDSWQARPALGLGYAWLDSRTFYGELNSQLTISPRETGPLRRINFLFAFDKINRSFASRDAFQVEVSPQFFWTNLIQQDIVLLTPFYRFNGVLGNGPPGVVNGHSFPLESHQFGGRADYYLSILQNLAIDISFTGYYQPFNEPVTNGTKDRHDRYLSPGAQVILKEFLVKPHDLTFGYQYEDNTSNDIAETYTNHIVSVRSLWHF